MFRATVHRRIGGRLNLDGVVQMQRQGLGLIFPYRLEEENSLDYLIRPIISQGKVLVDLRDLPVFDV